MYRISGECRGTAEVFVCGGGGGGGILINFIHYSLVLTPW